MRSWLTIIGVVFASATAGSHPAVTELRGTTQVGGRADANAVVWLDAPGSARTPRPGRVVLDQRDIDFWPHVLAVQTGTVVEFPNHDRVFHNVFSFHNNQRFDLGLYPVGAVKRITFRQAGLSRIFCNIHPNMAAYIMVVDTPYFAVSNKAGEFAIPDVEVGPHTFHAWRPGRQELTGPVMLESGASLDLQWP